MVQKKMSQMKAHSKSHTTSRSADSTELPKKSSMTGRTQTPMIGRRITKATEKKSR